MSAREDLRDIGFDFITECVWVSVSLLLTSDSSTFLSGIPETFHQVSQSFAFLAHIVPELHCDNVACERIGRYVSNCGFSTTVQIAWSSTAIAKKI